MAISRTCITKIDIDDIRVPTSDSLLGSDPFHRKPDYSAAVVRISTDTGPIGCSVVFGIGAGTDWLVYGLEDLSSLLVGLDIRDFMSDPGKVHRRLMEHHQLRWLGDGVYRMVVGGLVTNLILKNGNGMPSGMLTAKFLILVVEIPIIMFVSNGAKIKFLKRSV